MIIINAAEIFKKAAARQENLDALFEEFDVLDDAIAQVHEAHEKATRILLAYRKLDEEAMGMLPPKVRHQCSVVDQSVSRLAHLLSTSESSASLVNLRNAIKGF